MLWTISIYSQPFLQALTVTVNFFLQSLTDCGSSTTFCTMYHNTDNLILGWATEINMGGGGGLKTENLF